MLTVDYAERYMLDRVQELRNQLPNGDPFVFIGAYAVISLLARLFNGGQVECLSELGFDYEQELSENLFQHLGSLVVNFSLYHELSSMKLNLTHESERHLFQNCPDDEPSVIKYTIAAAPFLDDVEKAIKTMFASIKDDEYSQLVMAVTINDPNLPLVGHG